MHLLHMGRLGAGHVPVFFAITFVFMLGVTYMFSVGRGDVDPVLPYISTSGDARPESCVFSMLLNLCSLFTVLIITLRYSLVVELNRDLDILLKNINRLSLYVGILGGFGMFIVANFQETAIIQIHLTGAFMSFGSGCVYMIIQSWISFRMHPFLAGKRIAKIRLGVALASAVCFFAALFFSILASHTFHQFYPDLPTPRPWSRKYWPMPGYRLHCISALAEWTLAILHMAFLLSYSREFEKIRVEFGVHPLVTHLDQSPAWQSTNDLTNIN